MKSSKSLIRDKSIIMVGKTYKFKLVIVLIMLISIIHIPVAQGAVFDWFSDVGSSFTYFSNKNLKTKLPFGTFLTLGAFITLFFGSTLLNWYLALLGF